MQGLIDPSTGMVLETLKLLQGILPSSSFTALSELEGVDCLTCGVGTMDLLDWYSTSTSEAPSPQAKSFQEVMLPWDTWDARLVIGSMIKTIVDLIGDTRVRVREQAI